MLDFAFLSALNVNPGCNGGFIDVHHTSLGAGPEVYNSMGSSHNCVGGSETSCVPDHPPVGDASKTGMGSTVPSPAHWYAHNTPGCNGGVISSDVVHTSLAGCNNGGIVDGCDCPHIPGLPGGIADVNTTSLGAGPEVYNSMGASHNCVGGSETSCVPDHPPVGDASKTGMGSTVPSPAHWYAHNDGVVMKPSQALAVLPVTGTVTQGKKVCVATPGHLVMGCHAFTLAAIQGVVKGDFINFTENAAKNAEAVTPVGAFLIRKISA